MLTFYSQQGEDMYVFKKFINKVAPDGIFVELGQQLLLSNLQK